MTVLEDTQQVQVRTRGICARKLPFRQNGQASRNRVQWRCLTTNASLNAALVERLLSASSSDATHGSASNEEVRGLFGKLSQPLLRYTLSFGISTHDSEEVVQEAFLALFEHLRRDKSCANLYGWLFPVCHNLALKHLERTRGRTACSIWISMALALGPTDLPIPKSSW